MPAFPDWAAEYVGLPFAEHGRCRAGVDCWGLIRLILKGQFDIAVPAFSGGYEGVCDGRAIDNLIRGNIAEWRESRSPRAGDGVLLRARGVPMHVGLVVAPGWMLHIEDGINSVIESYTGVRWGKRLIGIYRHGAMTDGD